MPIAGLMWPYIERNLERLVALYEATPEAGRAWQPPAEGANSLAVIVSHTLSNAEDNLLGTVGGSEIVYERQVDFEVPETDAAVLRARWSAIRAAFADVPPRLPDDELLAAIPHPRRGDITKFETMLVVARHTSEHLAHAELTRDLYAATQHP